MHSCAVPDHNAIVYPPLLGTAPTVPPGNFASCSDVPGPDFGFSQGPMLARKVSMGRGRPRDVLAVGEKSGMFFAIDPDSGALIWSTRVSPGAGGGFFGGMQWGSATDGRTIYTASSNGNNSSRDNQERAYSYECQVGDNRRQQGRQPASAARQPAANVQQKAR